jgi:hypothetical protein
MRRSRPIPWSPPPTRCWPTPRGSSATSRYAIAARSAARWRMPSERRLSGRDAGAGGSYGPFQSGGGRRVVGADQYFVGPLTAGRARRDGDSTLLTSLTVCTWSRVRCRSSGGHSLAFGCREIRTYSACRRPGGLPPYRRKRWQAPSLLANRCSVQQRWCTASIPTGPEPCQV